MKWSVLRFLALFLLLLFWVLLTRDQVGLAKLKAPSPESTLLVLGREGAAVAYYAANTAVRVICGYLIGAVLGIIMALLMLYNRYLAVFLDSYVELIRPIPPIALTPFFIFWFGIGNAGQIILIAMVSFLVFTVTLFEAGSSFELRYVRAARTLGASRADILLKIILPGSMGQLAAAARVAVAGAVSVTVAAEYLGAQGGLGYMIRNARVTLETDAILVAVISLGILSFLLDRLVRSIFSRLTVWIPRDRKDGT